MKKIVDISMPIYSGRKIHNSDLYPSVAIERTLTPDMEKSFGRTGSKFIGMLHSGTHVDAPLHLMGSEAKRIGDYPLDKFIGEAVMADMRSKVPNKEIFAEDLEKSVGETIREGDILLIRTDMGKEWGSKKYYDDSPYLTTDAAQWCIDKKVKLVGVDFYHHNGLADVEFKGSKLLFKHDILTLTYLDKLWEISSERFTFIGLPIKVEDAEASLVRAVAIEE